MGKKVVIIGAGIGGLATANLLAKAGYDVAVYEKNSQPGGRAGQLKLNGFTFDTGPSWYLMPGVFKHYFKSIDENIDDYLSLVKLNPAYKVFFESAAPVVISGDEVTDEKTFESIEPGAGKALKRYVSKGEEVYHLALKHFLYTDFKRPEKLLHPDITKRSIKMGILATLSLDRYVSGYVKDQRLKQILEYPAVFLGASPFSTPALYSLMSALDFKEGVFYPRGGLYKIIEALTTIGSRLGVAYYYDSSVCKILNRGREVYGVEIESGEVVPADIVISNADLHFTETRLLETAARSFPESYWNKRTPGPSALLLYLGVKGTIDQLKHHNLLFVDDWQKNFSDIYTTKSVPYPASIYICNPSKSDPTVAPVDTENLFVLVPLPAGLSLSTDEQTDLVDTYIDQIAKMIRLPDLKKRITTKHIFGPDDFVTKFHAWQATALGPAHTLKQSAMFRTPNTSKKLRNLYYVGASTIPGIGLPMCLISAQTVSERVYRDHPIEKKA